MQNENVKKLLMAAVGMYLVYTGITLIRDVLISEPRNLVVFIIAGAVFVMIGLITAVVNLKSYIGYVKEMMAVNTEESFEDDTEDNVFEEQFSSISVTIPERVDRNRENVTIKLENTNELESEVIAEDAEDLEVTDEIKLDAENAIDIEDEE